MVELHFIALINAFSIRIMVQEKQPFASAKMVLYFTNVFTTAAKLTPGVKLDK